MSVAFRRESDDEHKEPTFELPIPPGPNLVTPEGCAQIAARVAALEAEIAGEADETRLASLKRDLRYWHTRLATAQVVEAPEPAIVGVGSRVTFRLEGRERTIAIVGGDEADPAAGKLAFFAPLARALLDAAAGDFVDFNGKAEAIEVVKVAP